MKKAEMYYRVGEDYFSREKDLDVLKTALGAFNSSEAMYIQAIQKGNPSLMDKLEIVRKKQKEVKECLDNLILQPTVILN